MREVQKDMCTNIINSGKFPPPEDVPRVGGGVICKQCGHEYYDHPAHIPYYFLTVLCDGSIVKL